MANDDGNKEKKNNAILSGPISNKCGTFLCALVDLLMDQSVSLKILK